MVKLNKYHGTPIVVSADKPDYGKRWGIAKKQARGCWCYTCTMKYLDAQRTTKGKKDGFVS